MTLYQEVTQICHLDYLLETKIHSWNGLISGCCCGSRVFINRGAVAAIMQVIYSLHLPPSEVTILCYPVLHMTNPFTIRANMKKDLVTNPYYHCGR